MPSTIRTFAGTGWGLLHSSSVPVSPAKSRSRVSPHPSWRPLSTESANPRTWQCLAARNVIYLIEERAINRPALVTDIGVRLPASLTASGKAMLAALPRPQLRALFRDTSPAGAGGPVTYRTLTSELSVVKAAGYAVEDEGVAEGLASIAVAVLDRSGWPIASITLTVPRDRHPERTWPGLAQEVDRYASELSRRIGSTG